MSAVWHHFSSTGAAASRNAILQALRDAGIRISPLTPRDGSGAGLLFFDQISPQLYEFVRQESRGGLGRILAVAVPGTEPGGGAWELLQSGASDVFAWDHSPN